MIKILGWPQHARCRFFALTRFCICMINKMWFVDNVHATLIEVLMRTCRETSQRASLALHLQHAVYRLSLNYLSLTHVQRHSCNYQDCLHLRNPLLAQCVRLSKRLKLRLDDDVDARFLPVPRTFPLEVVRLLFLPLLAIATRRAKHS